MPSRFPVQSNTLDRYLGLAPKATHNGFSSTLAPGFTRSSISSSPNPLPSLKPAAAQTPRITFPMKQTAAFLSSATKSQLIRYLRRHGEAGNNSITKPDLIERVMKTAIRQHRSLGIEFTRKEFMGLQLDSDKWVHVKGQRFMYSAGTETEARDAEKVVLSGGKQQPQRGLSAGAKKRGELRYPLRNVETVIVTDETAGTRMHCRCSTECRDYVDVGMQTDFGFEILNFGHLERDERTEFDNHGLEASTDKLGWVTISDAEDGHGDDDFALAPSKESISPSPSHMLQSTEVDDYIVYTCPSFPIMNKPQIAANDTEETREMPKDNYASVFAAGFKPHFDSQQCIFPGAFLEDSQVLKNDDKSALTY